MKKQELLENIGIITVYEMLTKKSYKSDFADGVVKEMERKYNDEAKIEKDLLSEIEKRARRWHKAQVKAEEQDKIESTI